MTMKKMLVASLVGGIILFMWQFISWGAANLHEPAQAYTDKQETILNFLNSQGLKEGGYLLPTAPADATSEQWEQLMQTNEGKPWASIQYHTSLKNNMILNMVRGLVINILTVFLFCWIIGRFTQPAFRTIFLASLFTGLIIFFNVPYTASIWYESFDIWIHLLDAVVSWSLVGAWLGWWLSRHVASGHSMRKQEDRPAYTTA